LLSISIFACNMPSAGASVPDKPILVSPVNNSVVETVDVILTVYVGDADNDALTVRFYNESGVLIDTVSTVSGREVSTVWRGRLPGTEYAWYANSSDGTNITRSDTFNFTVSTDVVPVNTDMMYAGIFLFLGIAALAEFRYRYSGASGMFWLVAVMAFAMIFVVEYWEWVKAVFIIITILYIYRVIESNRGAEA